MKINALMMDEMDNVVTMVEEVDAGGEVCYQRHGEQIAVRAEEAVPYCHKLALKDFRKGEDVIKYGESLGKATEDIAKGHLINERNLKSEPREYEKELAGADFAMCARQSRGSFS